MAKDKKIKTGSDSKNLVILKAARQDTFDEFGQKIDELTSKIKTLEELTSKIKTLEEKSKSMKFTLDLGQLIIIGVVIVLFIAVAGLLIDAYRFHGQSYTDLKRSVDELREDLFNKEQEIVIKKIADLEDKIETQNTIILNEPSTPS